MQGFRLTEAQEIKDSVHEAEAEGLREDRTRLVQIDAVGNGFIDVPEGRGATALLCRAFYLVRRTGASPPEGRLAGLPLFRPLHN